MRPPTRVETPQRTRVPGGCNEERGSAEGHRDEDTQRGVSTEAPTLYRGRFRVQSARLPGWDYTSNGYYFVTICTRDRVPFLGEVLGSSVRLSRIGEIVAAEWRGIAVRRRDVSLDEWVVMPNHLHGIVVIRRELGAVKTPQRGRAHPVPGDFPMTHFDEMRPTQRGVPTSSRLPAGSLGAVVGQFKSRSTKRIWQCGFPDFGWQPRFYDHIIHDDGSLDRIRQYIIDNPAKWDAHEETPENLWM